MTPAGADERNRSKLWKVKYAEANVWSVDVKKLHRFISIFSGRRLRGANAVCMLRVFYGRMEFVTVSNSADVLAFDLNELGGEGVSRPSRSLVVR